MSNLTISSDTRSVISSPASADGPSPQEWPDGTTLDLFGSPCQPFSSASRGAGRGFSSDKHLWPVWFDLIKNVRPPVIFGEQVASSGAWVDQVRCDLEGENFAFWPVIAPAGSVGADHIRERLWFLSHADSNSESRCAEHAEAPWMQRRESQPGGMVQENGLSDRVAKLRAFGNAIVPQVAAEVMAAYMEFSVSHLVSQATNDAE